MYLAQKRRIQTFIKSGGILVGAFILGFIIQTSFGIAEHFKADVVVSTPGSLQSMLTSTVQCSQFNRNEIPLSGGSGVFNISIDRPELGSFYVGNSTTPSQTPFKYTLGVDKLYFDGNTNGVVGNGVITVTDSVSNVASTVPVSVGYPCIESLQFCASITSTTPPACVPFTAAQLSTVVGNRTQIPYIEAVLAGRGSLASRTKIESLPLPNITFTVQGSTISATPGTVDLGYFYPSAVGTMSVLGEIQNPNAYIAASSRYSQALNFSVLASSCQAENNNIFTANVPTIIPNDFTFKDLPVPASTVYPFLAGDSFQVDGFTLDNTHYTFVFTPSTSGQESYKTQSDSDDVFSVSIFYAGLTIDDQIQSIMRAYSLIPEARQALRVERFSTNQIAFTSKESGRSAIHTAGNVWTIGKVGQSLTAFTSPAANPGNSAFAYFSKQLQPFPDTLVEGETLLAYYPGGNGHASWSAATSSADPAIQMERVAGVPLSFTPSSSISAASTLSAVCQKYLSYANNALVLSSTAPSTVTYNPATGQMVVADGVNNGTYSCLSANSTTTQDAGSQFLQDYNYYFAVVKAQKAGSALIHVRGLGCSYSKKIKVIPDQVEVLVQTQHDTKAKLAANDQIILGVNELATLSARLRGSEQPIADTNIEWVITDNINSNVLELQKTVVGRNTDGTNIYKTSNSFKTLQRGTALVRAKVASQISIASSTSASSVEYMYSQPILVTVRQGMEINEKGYDFTSEVFPGSAPKSFVVSGLLDSSGQENYSSLSWVTDDITHGTFVISGPYKNVLIYTPPVNDGSARLYIDNIRAIDKSSNQAVNVAIHVRPPKIINQFITDASTPDPVVNFAFENLQENGLGTPWIKNIQWVKAPSEGDRLSLGSCLVTFSNTAVQDTNCSDNSATLPAFSTVVTVVENMKKLSIPGLNISGANDALAISSSQNWALTDNTGHDIVIQEIDGALPQQQIAQWTPDTTKILLGDTVKVNLNGEILSVGPLTQADASARQTEIIQGLYAAKLIAGGEFGRVSFRAATAAGALVPEANIPTTPSLRSMAILANTPGYALNIVVNSIKSQEKLTLRLGRSMNLKIVALLEDGTLSEWKASANNLNSRIFGNPVWTLPNPDTSPVGIQNGLITAQKTGSGTVSLVTATRWYELVDSVAQASSATSITWVEHVENNPAILVPIEVIPAFKVNNTFRSNLTDGENTLKLVAKSGDQKVFQVTDVDPSATIIWTVLENQSGVTPLVTGNNFTYTAGAKNADSTGVLDVLRVSDGVVSYDLAISVNPAVLTLLTLLQTDPDNNPATPIPTVHTDNPIPLTLRYQIPGSAIQELALAQGANVPAILSNLTWESSDENIIHVANGQAVAMSEGTATITVSSALDANVHSSLIITVDGPQAKFVDGGTRIIPAFPAIDALIHIETTVYHKAGIDNIQGVSIKFNSPYLPDAQLVQDATYLNELQSRTGVSSTQTINPVTSGATSNETTPLSNIITGATGTLANTQAQVSTQREARYILDYQLPGEKSLEGKTITYVLMITTKQGVRTETSGITSATSPTLAADAASQNTVSQMGVITIGAVQNICTANNKLMCLIKGLQCLKQKSTGVLTEECDQVISVFTSTPQSFNAIDILTKYRKLKGN